MQELLATNETCDIHCMLLQMLLIYLNFPKHQVVPDAVSPDNVPAKKWGSIQVSGDMPTLTWAGSKVLNWGWVRVRVRFEGGAGGYIPLDPEMGTNEIHIIRITGCSSHFIKNTEHSVFNNYSPKWR